MSAGYNWRENSPILMLFLLSLILSLQMASDVLIVMLGHIFYGRRISLPLFLLPFLALN
jgi:hypothetical protein